MIRLREMRKQHGYTQKELASMVNVQEAAISKYETGRVSPSADVLIKFSTIFDCSIDYLLGKVDHPKAILWTDVPQEMKNVGIDAVEILQEALDEGFNKKDIKMMIKMFKQWKAMEEDE